MNSEFIITVGLWLALVAECGLATPRGASRQIPPVGHRIYILGEDGGKEAVRILKDEGRSPRATQVLRDPTKFPGKSVPPSRSRKSSIEPRQDQAPRERHALLRFRKLTILGKSSKPRQEFTLEKLRIERVDEPEGRDFFGEIFSPLESEDF